MFSHVRNTNFRNFFSEPVRTASTEQTNNMYSIILEEDVERVHIPYTSPAAGVHVHVYALVVELYYLFPATSVCGKFAYFLRQNLAFLRENVLSSHPQF